jgi:flagellar protein FlaG
MDKAIVTVLLIICGVVATLAIFNGLYPALTQSQGAISSAADQASDRMQSRIKIIQAGSSGTQVSVWVKNIGLTTVSNIQQSDFFLSAGTNLLTRVTYNGTEAPSWSYTIPQGETDWSQTVTIGVTITLSAPLSPGTYSVTMVIPNGVSDEVTFGVG